MTAHHDLDRLLNDFLRDGPTELPYQSFDAVRDLTEHTRQRAVIGPWRISTMTRFVAIGTAAVAVLVLAVIGSQVFGSPSNVGGGGDATPTPQPTPTLEPTAEPTATPSPVTKLPSWYSNSEANGAGILAAASHTTRRFSPGFTFSVPEGWVNPYDEAGYFQLFPDTLANQTEFARSEELAQVIFGGMQPAPWFSCESLENNRGATAADIVAAASANEALTVSDPVDVAIGGLTGMQFDVQRNPDWTGTCPGDSELPPGLDPEDERTRGILLDVPGRGVLVIFLYSMSSAEHEAFLAEAMPIVESFQFSQ